MKSKWLPLLLTVAPLLLTTLCFWLCNAKAKGNAKAKDAKAKGAHFFFATFAFGCSQCIKHSRRQKAKAKVAQRITQGTLAWVGRLLLCRQRKSAPKAQGQKGRTFSLPAKVKVAQPRYPHG